MFRFIITNLNDNVMTSYDLVVIGGGVSGAFTAYFALLNGFRVALVEINHLGSGSSGRSAGIHTTQLVLPSDIELSKRSIRIYSELCPEGFSRTGFLSVEPDWMSKYSAKLLEDARVRYRVLSNDELRDVFSWAVFDDNEVGVYTPDDGVADIPRILDSLRLKFREMGAGLYEGREIVDLDIERGRLTLGGASTQTSLGFGGLVLAAGSWNRGLARRWLKYDLPVALYACQVVLLKTLTNCGLTPVYFENSHLYVRSMGMDRLLAGNGGVVKLDDPLSCPPSPEPQYLLELSEKLAARLRSPEHFYPCGGWTGVCSSSPDGLPLVGRVPGLENVYIMDGLDGYGIMRAPALAQDLVKLISKGAEAESSRALDPARFGSTCGEPQEVIELHSML